ncbi:gamma-aminobutyric acid receptor subunit beta-like isoform X2 [Lineus longissimus]|uniref:gamma-aminobutyric acid receptor subunit beta-like isoform X2 n=1 Tax=Lineus longissimus TaxID=88925 RepID=UPI002B4D7E58
MKTLAGLLMLVFTLLDINGSYGADDQQSLDIQQGIVKSGIQNVSGIINNLLQGYDIRLRPSFGGDPLEIEMEIVIASFDSISEVNMDYTITLYLNQYWRDERLKFSDDKKEQMTLTGDFAEKIWVPDTFFANDKNSFLHDVTEKNKMVKLYGDGSITYGMRFTTTLACMMDLHYYPLDQQNCTVEVESYGYPMEDVVMIWKDGKKSVVGVERIELPQFSVKEYRTISTVESLSTGRYQRLSLSFLLERNIGYFIFQTYLPSILIVMLSWVSFWINHEATSARVALGITTVLTMTTISTGVRSSLPRISYVKAIDIYLVMCFVFVFAALLEYAMVNYTYWGARAKKKAKSALKKQENYNRANTEENEYVHEAIELQDIRMSPILSLRNKQNYNFDENSVRVTPSFRMPTTVPRASYPVRTGHSQLIRRRNQSNVQRRKRVMTHIKKKAQEFRSKIPQIRDVNKIDKYSRLVFPSLFILFNLCYWCFYLIR